MISTLSANQNGPIEWPAMRGPSGPPRNRVVKMAELNEGHVLGQVEQGEADGRVLQVEAAGQLLFGLDEVKGRAGHLGGDGDEEDGRRGAEGAEDVPVVKEPAVLRGDDGAA